MKGYSFAFVSIVLVSIAQLFLRWAMLHLNFTSNYEEIVAQKVPILVLVIGLGLYVLSMVTWMIALRYLALSRAYPLLSFSYVLVWILVGILPGTDEPFHFGSIVGIALIVVGLIVSVRSK